MRHGDIKELQVSLELKFIRDFNNVLGFLKAEEHQDYLFAINEDTLGSVCKFHNISKKEALNKLIKAPSTSQ